MVKSFICHTVHICKTTYYNFTFKQTLNVKYDCNAIYTIIYYYMNIIIRIFIKELANQLVMPHMIRRSRNNNLSRATKECMAKFIVIDYSNDVDQPIEIKRRRCTMCSSSIDHKRSTICYKCCKNDCKQHSSVVCNSCKV